MFLIYIDVVLRNANSTSFLNQAHGILDETRLDQVRDRVRQPRVAVNEDGGVIGCSTF